MSQTLPEFLEEDGAWEILCALSNEELNTTELEEQIRVSRGTMYKRLNEGEDLHLFEYESATRDGSAVKIYKPTFKARTIQIAMGQHHVQEIFRELCAKEEEFERQCEAVKEYVGEHGIRNLEEVFGYDPIPSPSLDDIEVDFSDIEELDQGDSDE